MAMNPSENVPVYSFSKAVRLLLVLVAITAVLSLLYGIQYYVGGPLRLRVISEFHSLDLSPNRSMIAAGAEDGNVRVWELPRNLGVNLTADFNVAEEPFWPVRIFVGSGGPILESVFGLDGTTLISASRDGQVRFWDVASGQVQNEQTIEGGPFNDVDVSADRSTLAAVGADGIVRVWDLENGQKIQAIGPDENTKWAVALNADGSLVAAGNGPDVLVWNATTGEQVQSLAGYWEDPTTEEQWLGHTKDVTTLAFSPDSKVLASGGADTNIVFWEMDTGEVDSMAEGHNAAVLSMIFDPQGDILLSASQDTKLRTIRAIGGKSTATYEGHLNAVNRAVFGPTTDTLLSAGNDGTLRLWETANQKVIHLEWSRLGLQPVWGKVLAGWMLLSGLVGLVVLWALWKRKTWGHLVHLSLFILGPIPVLGLPLFEAFSYPLTLTPKIQIAWPLILLAVWYVGLVAVSMREPVAVFYEAPQSAALAQQLVVSRRTARTRFGIFSLAVWILLLVILYSILRRFNLDIAFMQHWFRFIMQGAWITLRVSALSIALAVVLALMGALGRLSKSAIANGVSSFYISLIRGTPLLVQIYIWYLGLPRLGVVLPAELAGILALGVNYGAYMTEIFRAGIQAIGKGQHEAAEALGMSRGQTFRRIVLPQAFRIVIPPIGNEFIAMMKDSSLVSVMAIWELTYRAQKIGRQNFRNMETFIIAAAFYWLLTVVFQFLQGKLEERMARGERR
jgi:polar amino acid transport system permease protein